ncbi:DnaJ subfamily A member 2 [Tetrabaena socialis]|uniref:DnaJ subfamily A member 2 n=1 Tax=Tetrabaena socialis TaxID=47790 RepID=A0A2J8AJ98_9CHLO|nr:DnaJ subfamily A member 2 [Tetrabaena socialis]|eukprot:PNH12583.1 DnaJ subfamily A member 2 [Tetrabaena socialis]
MSMDPYKVLGVQPSASADEVRRAYKSLALQWHPDKNASPEADSRFKEVARAFSVLSDPDRRALYDATGSMQDGSEGGQQMGDIFNNMFASFMQPPQFFNVAVPPADVIDVPISLKEVRDGCVKKLEFEQPDRCGQCRGCGRAEFLQCNTCAGKGRVSIMSIPGIPVMVHIPSGSPCPACSGLGTQADRSSPQCPACAGNGVLFKRRMYEVRIMPGMVNGHVEVLKGRVKDVHLRMLHTFEEGVSLEQTGRVVMIVNISLEEVMCGFQRHMSLSHVGEFEIVVNGYRNPTMDMVLDGKGLVATAPLILRFVVTYPDSDLSKYKDVFKRVFSGHKKGED